MSSSFRKKGTLYMVPVGLGNDGDERVIPGYTLDITRRLRCFIAENAKSARHFLKRIGVGVPLHEIYIMELDKHAGSVDFEFYFSRLREGEDTGFMSEAGMPGIADPGSEFVRKAHQENIPVIPLPGPSSIFLALSASGLNGQQFTFHGYLSKRKEELKDQVKKLESDAIRKNQSQIFIETPYRNESLFESLVEFCRPDTLLCIAVAITQAEEKIETRPISAWKSARPSFHRKPAVFIIGK